MSDQNAITIRDESVRLGSLQLSNPEDVTRRASTIAKELAKIIQERKLYRNISGRNYTFVDGWTTMGGMLGVVAREAHEPRLTVYEDGMEEYESTVELVRMSDGQVVGRASAIVGQDEPTWAKRPRYARRSMSTTRATGKAFRLSFSWIMVLAGYEATPAEEMDGVIIEAEVIDRQEPKQKAKTNGGKAERPLEPEQLKEMLQKKAEQHTGKSASQNQVGLVAGMLDVICIGDEDKRHSIQGYLFGALSLKDTKDALILAALDWLKPTKDSGGQYNPDPISVVEAEAVWTASLKAEGQQELI